MKEIKWNEIFVPTLIYNAENIAKVLGVFFDSDCKYIFQEDAGNDGKENNYKIKYLLIKLDNVKHNKQDVVMINKILLIT